MHLFKQYAVGDYDAAARMIPIMDYGPYFAGAPGALEGVAADVARASENVGFFYALNHGVSDDTIERAFAASRRFHALPLEQKLALRLDDNNIGYLAINASVQGASAVHKATQPNQNESFFVTHDRGPDHPDVIAPRYAPAVYRDLVLEFYRANYFHQKGHRSAVAERAVGAVA